VSRRLLLVGLLALAAGPAAAATPPDPQTPEEAITVVKRILKKSVKACGTDWATIDVVGYRRDWKITVKVRESAAGRGAAKWKIGRGWPVATNALAKAVARGCPAA
jgi:hypothetical protein